MISWNGRAGGWTDGDGRPETQGHCPYSWRSLRHWQVETRQTDTSRCQSRAFCLPLQARQEMGKALGVHLPVYAIAAFGDLRDLSANWHLSKGEGPSPVATVRRQWAPWFQSSPTIKFLVFHYTFVTFYVPPFFFGTQGGIPQAPQATPYPDLEQTQTGLVFLLQLRLKELWTFRQRSWSVVCLLSPCSVSLYLVHLFVL